MSKPLWNLTWNFCAHPVGAGSAFNWVTMLGVARWMHIIDPGGVEISFASSMRQSVSATVHDGSGDGSVRRFVSTTVDDGTVTLTKHTWPWRFSSKASLLGTSGPGSSSLIDSWSSL